MKRMIFDILLILCTSLIPIEVSDASLNILYSVTGVLFSVGMSLLIAFNVSEVRNDRLKKELRDGMHSIRNSFTRDFLVSSVIFILYSLLHDESNEEYKFTVGKVTFTLYYSISVMFFLVKTIGLYIIGFFKIQKFYEELEDKIAKEKQ